MLDDNCEILWLMSRFLTLTLSLAACLVMPTWAATQCPEHFVGGVAPTVTNPKLKARTQEVCFEAFAVCIPASVARPSIRPST